MGQQDFFKHSFKSKARENLGLTVYNSGFQKCPSGYTWGPALRDHYLIHYIVLGRGSYTVEGQTHSLGAGDLFFVYDSQVVSYRADDENPWEYYWVGFNGTEARRLVRLLPFTSAQPCLHIDSPKVDAQLRESLLKIYGASGTSPASEVRMAGALYLFLASLMELSSLQTGYAPAPPSYAQTALRFIRYNYSHDISIHDIARAVGISRSHLYRLFMESVGLSPTEYLTQFRVNQACALLRNSALSVKEVASSVGFSDPLYFSRVFKKYKGTAPSRYLREISS